MEKPENRRKQKSGPPGRAIKGCGVAGKNELKSTTGHPSLALLRLYDHLPPTPLFVPLLLSFAACGLSFTWCVFFTGPTLEAPERKIECDTPAA